MTRHAIPLIVFILLLLLLWVGLGLNPRELPSPLVGRAAPSFSVPDLMQPEQRVDNALIQGRVTVLNVFASWCVSCRAEHHLLQEMEQRGVYLIGLNYKDERSDAINYLRRGGRNPYAVIGHDLNGKAGIEWGVYATPETFVIDKRGVIRHKFTGPLNRSLMENQMYPLLSALEQES